MPSSIPLLGKVVVALVSAIAQASPSSWQIAYEVRNRGQSPIWLVDDGFLVLRKDGARIELSYARAPMRAGAQAFGYFEPKVVRVAPGRSVKKSIEIRWPARLSDLWNAEAEAAPPPGTYEVVVRVGYGVRSSPRAPRLGESVEAPVLRWQREAVSAPVSIEIPPYRK